MRKIMLVFILIVAATLAPAAVTAEEFGSVFGNLCTAQSYGQGIGTIGIAGGLAEANSISGWFGFGMSKYIDGRVKLGLWDMGPKTQLSIGGDAKWQFWSVAEGSRYPLDLAIGGFLEYMEYDRFSVLQIGSHLVGSYPIKIVRGTLSPYGRASVRLESRSAEDKTDLKFGLTAGAAWDATQALRFLGEFQLDGNNGVFFGVEFGVM